MRRRDDERGNVTGAAGLWVGVVVLGGLVGAAAWLTSGLPLPVCRFKQLTGLPCLSCGSTRMLSALLEGEVGQAFVLNPLMFTAVAALLAWSLVSTAGAAFGIGFPRFTAGATLRRVAVFAAASTAITGWVYLFVNGI